ncbi:phage integrase family protein [Pandoraea oxalativorans]|uniref:Integrase n=1 Tax=Pandoraea oxalativorans TaxID=573737 RepID=A0A0G3IET9_9BURK|nr:phage integrase family protein [Pandoraea oxalativorans]AKK25068.1 hypothetical protein MB84_30515 [Pandoraea oxalativorans]
MTQPAGGKQNDNPAVADVTDVASRAAPASAAKAPDSECVSRAVRGRARTRAEWERREHLGIDHFAFFRGYLERLPLDKLADQYLETGLDLRMARSTLLWIQARLIAGARRAQDYRAARLLAIAPEQLVLVTDASASGGSATAAATTTPQAVSARRPSLDEFAEEHDPNGFYSQRELLELFAEHHPEAKPDRRAERNERLRRRQVAALRALQTLLAVAPAQHHHCAGWFHPALARRLEHAGIIDLADLFDVITHRGPRWYTRVRGLGETGAKRLQQWLADHADALKRTLPAYALTPRRQLTHEARRAARQQVDGVAPLEWLVWPDFARAHPASGDVTSALAGDASPWPERQTVADGLDGIDGTASRGAMVPIGAPAPRVAAMAPERQTRAGSDVEAVKAWLAAMAAGLSPTTVQSYRQHAERLLNWLAFVRQRPLAAMTVEDCTAYRAFLADPPAHWIVPRGTARFTRAWRPFSKPLEEPSVRLSMTVLRRMCSWLCAAQYLRFNPFALMARPRGDAFDTLHVERVLTDGVWDALEAYWRPRAIHDASAERTLFALQLARTTGLRLAELARATVGDLRCTVLSSDRGGSGGTVLWSLSVLGKGRRRREVELAGSLVRRIEAHLNGRGIAAAQGSTLRQIVAEPALAGVALIGRLPGVRPPRTQAAASAANGGTTAKEEQETIVEKPVKRGMSLHAPLTPGALRQVIEQGYRGAARTIAQQQADAAGTVAMLSRATPHWLRHTFGTHALEHGAALEVVQQLMGHASIATTSKYLHPEKRRRAADMDKVFGS